MNARRQPNILLIILDTLRRDRLSLYGHTAETSPALDRFAADATLFTRAIAPAQWTVPAHASLFTGLYPSEHRLTQGNGLLSGAYPTLAEILRGAGYETVAFCNNPLVGALDHGLQRGFDHFYNYSTAVPNRPFDSRRPFVRREFSRRFRPTGRKIGNAFARHDALFRLSLHPLLTPIWARGINFKGSTENSIGDLIDLLAERRAGGQAAPLFTFVNLMGAHLPYQPPRDALQRVAPDVRADKQAHAFMRRWNADAAAWASPTDPPLTDWQRRTLLGFYDAEIARQDAQVGRLLAALRTSGALDDTIVIVTADHGEAHGDHDLFGHGFVVYQELVHVPLIIHAPEYFPRGREFTDSVSTRRLFHTVLDLAGVEPPLDAADPNADVAGLSLLTAVEGGRQRERDLAFSEAVPPTTFLHVIAHRNPDAVSRLMLRQTRRGLYRGSHKLAVVGERVEGLYDLARDAADARDVAAEQPAVAQALQAEISAFVAAATGDQAGTAEPTAFSPAVEEQLRALGYLE